MTATATIVERLASECRDQVAGPVATWFGLAPDQLATTWPQMFGPRADTRHYVIRDDAQAVVAHAAARTVRVTVGPETTTCEFIGGVATDPATRGRGYASALVTAIEDDARAFRTQALVLWSDLHEFYGRLGFVPTGEQWEIELPDPDSRRDAVQRLRRIATDVSTRAAQPSDELALFELHARNPVGVRRCLRDIQVLWTTRPLMSWVAERGTDIVAYACRDKGADLAHWWHDFGGADRDVAALLASAIDAADAPLTLMLPNYRLELLGALVDEQTPARVTTGCCALTRFDQPPHGMWLDDLFIDGLDSV